jgi:L-threonylcarbamoyladenylate synthase
MEIINLKKFNKKNIEKASSSLKNGAIIVLPTDTIYGISSLAENLQAIKKINKIKNREQKKSFIILMSDYEMIKKYCIINKEQEKILKNFWSKNKKPTTIILNSNKTLPKEILNNNSLAVRIPQKNFLKKIIKETQQPIISTSLNISGKKHLENLDKIEKYFQKDKPDLCFNIGELKGQASKIIDLRDVKNIKIIRE